MDTWFWSSPGLLPAEQTALLKKTGFAGMALSWGMQHRERFAALKDAGLGMPGIYTTLSIDAPDGPPWLGDLAALLKGTGGIVWLALTSKTFPRSDPAGDGAAASLTAKLASLGVEIAFYPHTGCWMERIGDAVRLAQKVARKDVGVQFNQYHWMAAEGGKDLEAGLEAARPLLRGVSLNGSGLKPSILPLGEGEYPTFRILQALQKIGYKGIVATQGYSIKGDIPAKLEASKKTWDGWLQRLEGN